jgi:hypothetical protein
MPSPFSRLDIPIIDPGMRPISEPEVGQINESIDSSDELNGCINSVGKTWRDMSLAEKFDFCYNGPAGKRWVVNLEDSPKLRALKERANILVSDIESGCEDCIPDDRTPPPHSVIGVELVIRVKQIQQLQTMEAAQRLKENRREKMPCTKCGGGCYIDSIPKPCLRHEINCRQCDGSGLMPSQSVLCDRCHGTGFNEY